MFLYESHYILNAIIYILNKSLAGFFEKRAALNKANQKTIFCTKK